MNKKLILSVSMIVLSVLTLASCNTKHDHKYDGYSHDDTQHWQVCTVDGCSEITGKENHHGGTATETEKAKCEVCGVSYGSLKAHEHAFTVEKVDATYLVSAADCNSPAVYYKSCACGEKGTETFTNGEALGHSYATTWSKDEIHHWHECTREGCTATDTKVAHSGGTATETETAKCEICQSEYGEKLPHNHTFEEVADEAHLKTAADCENPAVYYKSCECGEKGTETFTSGEPLNHHMVDNFDETYHWTECDRENCSYETSKVAHLWDEGTITTNPTEQEDGVKTFNCTGCDATKEEPVAKLSHTHVPSADWTSDGSQHWKTCSGCYEKLDLDNHNEEVVPGEPATCLAPGKEDGKKCSVCEKVILEQTPITQLNHSYTGDYVDNGDGTHSQKCVNGCENKSEGVTHVYTVLEKVSESSTGGEFLIKCVCGNAHTLTINGQTDCDVELVELSDKLVLRATLKESVISNLQTTLPTVHADVIAGLESWYMDIAPTEQFGFEKYIVYVSGKEATVEEQAPGDNNYQFKVAIRKDETMKIYKEGTPITIGETTEVVYTATADGIYTIYVNASDQIWVDPNVSGIPYSVYSLTVNGQSSSSENVAGSTEYAKFVVTLQVDDVLVVLGDTTELLSYTATKVGEHTVVVDKHNVVTVSDPDVVKETITFHYYNNLNWTSVNLHAWTEAGDNFTGGSWPGAALTEEGEGWWTITIEAESFEGLMIIFNGSGGQTTEITYVDGLDYYYGKSSIGYSTSQEAKAASEVAVIYDYYMRGTMNNWTGTEEYGLTKSGTEYVITVTLSANAEFKIVADATSWNKGDWGYNNVEDGCKSLVSNNGGNIKVNSAGTYTIYFKPNQHSMWIAKA